ncbi:MAG: nucleoside triphosphate pyrophosphohydrolase [Firmicutes bacterium]|jgi:predicted house-cleaning noncanonical NTP pyrophosphatase (MazG superfamily)|nr:nucleoside triphosphate pyrophosphohydrolase [Bacillota bacterium]
MTSDNSTTVLHNKLVRDRIPELIRRSHKTCKTRNLNSAELELELERKLDEELKEYHETRDVSELVDLIEVIYAIARRRDVSPAGIEEMRLAKREERGGFDEGLFLISVSGSSGEGE